jgi:N-methylhydantoinase A/oxoprolinase/acetone carboxylase beta subunit
MRVGADVGGTFTDVLALDSDGRVRITKVLSTPPDYDRAVIDAVGEVAGPDVEAIVHGTTVATNAVLERRGARTALVTTEGFRDVLELRRMRSPHPSLVTLCYKERALRTSEPASSTPPSARVRRSPTRRRGRCWSTNTTRRSSSHPGGA